jgi:CRISPR-associated protein Csd2
MEQEGYKIFVKEGAILNNSLEEMYKDLGVVPPVEKSDDEEDEDSEEGEEAPKSKRGGKQGKQGRGKGGGRGKGKDAPKAKSAEEERAMKAMCERYFDVRTFGAVMSTGEAKAGQVRGPVQFTFARSLDPIFPLESSITRMAVTTQKESDKQNGKNQTMGRKHTVPYGLYLGYGFISAAFAQKTEFSEDDLSLVWEALENMFEHDRSAARGLMAVRRLFIFKHESALGNTRAQSLFNKIKIARRDVSKPVRAFSDYEVSVERESIPSGVELIERVLD